MESRARSPLWCAAIGAFSGARTTLGPLLVCERVLDEGVAPGAVPARWLQSARVATMIGVLAIVETVVDKLPFIPERTHAIALAPRIASGALAGAALSSVDRTKRRDVILGALLGATGAIAGAFVAVHVRRLLARGLPDVIAGIGEDAMLVALSRTVLARM